MNRFHITLCVLGVAALLAVSASAQTLNSAIPQKPNDQLEILSKKALEGDTNAQLRMGLAFEFGEGVDKNLDEAMRWYRKAADRGDPLAQTNLAYLYESGGAGSANPEEAAKVVPASRRLGLGSRAIQFGNSLSSRSRRGEKRGGRRALDRRSRAHRVPLSCNSAWLFICKWYWSAA